MGCGSTGFNAQSPTVNQRLGEDDAAEQTGGVDDVRLQRALHLGDVLAVRLAGASIHLFIRLT
jgi:hypothetical protein